MAREPLNADRIARAGGATAARLRRLRMQVPYLPPRPLVQKVMATPPTLTFDTNNALSTGRLWPSVQTVGSATVYQIGGQFAALSRAAAPAISQTAYPGYFCVKYTNVDYTGTPNFNQAQVSVIHTGSRIVARFKGFTGGQVMAKVNGEYISLTPSATPGDGGLYFYDLDFGSSSTRRVDILFYGMHFGGFFTGTGDSIVPAPLRGPKIAFQDDSYGAGTGSTQPLTWINRFLDAMGWDNAIIDAVGGTGMLNTAYNYRARFDTDIAPYEPDIILFKGSQNDASYTPSELADEALELIAEAEAANPEVLCVFTSQPVVAGPSASGKSPWLKRDAVKAAVEGAGHMFIDWLEQPLGAAPVVTATLNSAAAASATTVSFAAGTGVGPLQGGTYAFADGQRIRVNNQTGTGPWTVTLDSPLQAAQSSGATLTLVGDCPWFGNGKVGSTNGSGSCDTLIHTDGSHPSQAGHNMLGDMTAARFMEALRAAA